MTRRSKVKLELIQDEPTRKATFKKRRKGLLKKSYELTTLCDVEGCVLLNSPYLEQIEAWPSVDEAHQVIEKFMSLSKEEKGKKMLDQETYLNQRIMKVNQQLEKLKGEKQENDITKLMHGCLNGQRCVDELNLEETKKLCLEIESTKHIIAERIEFLQNNGANN